VKAVGTGMGLKQTGPTPQMMMQQGMPRGQPMGPNVQPNPMQIGKLPSSIKTNIKSAQLHPYR
jgi:hypothetical protein